MAVKIRLQRRGKKRAPYYHIVIADARAPRDGRFIEKIGSYNPMTKPATIDLDREAAFDWLGKGAQPTDTVRAIMRFKGVYYKKHLLRGVKKGVLTQEEADKKYEEWIEAKDVKIAKDRQKALDEINAFNAKVAGLDIVFKAPEKVVPEVEVKEAAPAKAAEEAPDAETTEEAPAPEKEEAPAAEAKKEEAAAEEE